MRVELGQTVRVKGRTDGVIVTIINHEEDHFVRVKHPDYFYREFYDIADLMGLQW